jgi:hypothetical protein
MRSGGVAVTEPVSKPIHAAIVSEDSTRADEAFQQIRESLRGLRFGSVNIIVQDGVVIQIDRTEKRRLRGSRNSST